MSCLGQGVDRRVCTGVFHRDDRFELPIVLRRLHLSLGVDFLNHLDYLFFHFLFDLFFNLLVLVFDALFVLALLVLYLTIMLEWALFLLEVLVLLDKAGC